MATSTKLGSAKAQKLRAAAKAGREAQAIAIHGYDEFMAKLDAKALAGDAIEGAFDRLGAFLVGEVKTRIPVDTGRARRSINHEVQSDFEGWTLRIGSDVHYAPMLEFGTGSLSDSPLGGKAGHRPPAAALDRWASRHGMPNGYVVARAIARRGGLAPKRMFRDIFDAHDQRIRQTLDHVAKAVEQEWGRG